MPQAPKLPITEAYFAANWAATTLGNAKPYQIHQIVNMLRHKKNYREADELAGANEPTLTTIFSDGIS